jgi:threonine aldolase
MKVSFFIDLRSDTLTLPSWEMKQSLLKIPLGDDSYNEDPNVRELEEYCAQLFSKEAALFMPSGTMSNQVALRAYTHPGDEVITEASYHINFFESAQSAALSAVTLNTCHSSSGNGILSVSDVKKAYEVKYRGGPYAAPKLLFLENTVNAGAGAFYRPEQINTLVDQASKMNMKTHIDGARILNASVAAKVLPSSFKAHSLSLCLAKGLGAPFGSVLMGNKAFIEKSKIFRKWFGGCLHQSGLMAYAALYALKSDWWSSMSLDHEHAAKLALCLREFFPAKQVHYQGTNIVILSLGENTESSSLVLHLKERGILAFPWNDNQIRFVTHKDINSQQMSRCLEVLKEVFAHV